MAGHYGAWVSLGNQRRALAELDDHLLRDIGLTAYDVTREASEAVLAVRHSRAVQMTRRGDLAIFPV